jgi:hypothetical protein
MINAEDNATKPTESAAVSEKSTPSPTPTLAEKNDQVINTENNTDFAALLAATDYCGPSMAQFAAKYQGREIEFDGSITNMQHHGNYDTRYDILVGPGDAGPKTTAGPAFKYEDVNMFDLKLAGNSVPSYVAEGDKFRFTAEVGEYKPNQGCLFYLTPVSTMVRQSTVLTTRPREKVCSTKAVLVPGLPRFLGTKRLPSLEWHRGHPGCRL